MTKIVSRELKFHSRIARQSAELAIKKDLVRALVELITNCDDSYREKGKNPKDKSNEIIVEIDRKRENAIVRVIDFAGGMWGEKMDEAVGEYAGETSAFYAGEQVRGYFGRGLKDAIIGLGEGRVMSIRDGNFHSCALYFRNNKPHYDREKPTRATRSIKSAVGIGDSGTSVEIIVTRNDVSIPQLDPLRRKLENHFALREILADDRMCLKLREVSKKRIKSEMALTHSYPVGRLLFDDRVQVKNNPVSFRLQLFRSDVPLTSPREDGYVAQGGVLICSGVTVLENQLFGFDGNPFAEYLYGKVVCEHLDELLKANEPIIRPDRSVDWDHDFMKSLKKTIEEKLEIFVEEEKKRLLAAQNDQVNKHLRKKFDKALEQLNQIAKDELKGAKAWGDDETEKLPDMPEGGFGFVPEIAYIISGKEASLLVRANVPEVLSAGKLVRVESESHDVEIISKDVVIEPNPAFPNIGEARVVVEGRRVGSESYIVARCEGLEAMALVKVIAKRAPHEFSKRHPRKGGLFKDIKFSAATDPRQRVRYDGEGNVVIATNAKSVQPYIRDESGSGSESPQGQVLIAELVTEAVCKEIARQGVKSGNFISIPGSETDAVQKEYLRLQNQYAHLIHMLLVDSKYMTGGELGGRHRGGRPPKVRQLENSVIEV